MRILARQILRGPNIHAPEPVVRLILDQDALREWPGIGTTPRPTASLVELLPGLETSSRERPSLWQRLQGGEKAILADVVAAVAIELQVMAGAKHSFCRARRSSASCDAIFPYDDEEVGVRAGELAARLVRHLTSRGGSALLGVTPAFDPAKARDAFVQYAQGRALDQTTLALVREAERRDIPWFRLSSRSRIVQFGHGRFQKRAHETVTSDTGAIATWIAGSKALTNRVLGQLGLPVPPQQAVRTAQEAARAAARIGYPVVVKPSGRGQGRGVSVGVADAASVEAAFARAREFDATVVVEGFIAGDDHRLLVVKGRLVAAAKRLPARVVGDGSRSVRALIEAENRDPRRGAGFSNLMNKIDVDAEVEAVLAAAGRTLATIPSAGEVVALRRTANIHTGGTAVDVTGIVHPDNRWMVERAAAALGIDIVGVDFLTPDIGRSYREIGGGICEVNQSPGLRPHWVAEGSPDATRAIIETFYPPGDTGRIPIAAVTGTNGKTTTCRMVAHILASAGHRVGLCTTDGVSIDGHEVVKGDSAGYGAARMILADPVVDAAVLEAARGGIIGRGLGFDWCNVGALLSVTEDHLGTDGIDTLEQMAAVKRLVTDLARDCAVFNADNELSLRMAAGCRARQVCLVSLRGDHTAVREHVARGGRAVVLRGGAIVLLDAGRETKVVAAGQVPATLQGRAVHNVMNAMFAAAIAHGLGKTVDQIRDGLASFDCTFAMTPGRTNVFEGHPFTVVLDYASNPAAIDAIVRFVQTFEVRGRRLCAVSVAADRSDEHHAATVRILAAAFDRFICKEDRELRGRKPTESMRRLYDHFIACGVAADRLSAIREEHQAVQVALEMALPGDLLLIIGENWAQCWRQIVEFEHVCAAPAVGS